MDTKEECPSCKQMFDSKDLHPDDKLCASCEKEWTISCCCAAHPLGNTNKCCPDCTCY